MTADFVTRCSSLGEPQAAFGSALASPRSSADQEPAAAHPSPFAASCPRSGLAREAEPEGPGWGSGADPPNGPKARTP